VRATGKKSRGQFIIITAFFIAIIMLSILPRVYFLGLQYRYIQYEPFKEIADNVNSDFERVLERSLSIASLKYNETFHETNATYADLMARSAAHDLISKWVSTVVKAYAGHGLQIELISYGNLTNIEWFELTANSTIKEKIRLNLTSYGLYGCERLVSVEFRVAVDESSITILDSTITLNFTATKENREPVTTLTESSLRILYFANDSTWKEANITSLSYYGLGVYEVSFSVGDDYDGKFRMYIIDDRKIMVINEVITST